MQEEQKLLKGVKKRPLGEQTDALFGDYLPVRRTFPVAQLQQLTLRFRQLILRIVLVEADDARVHPLKVLHRQHKRGRHGRSHSFGRPALNCGAHGEAEEGDILPLQGKGRTVGERVAVQQDRLEADVLGPAHRALEAEVDVAAHQAAIQVPIHPDKAVRRLLAAAGDNERQFGDDELVAGRQVGGAAIGKKVGRAGGVVDVGGVAVGGEFDQLVAGPRRFLALVEYAQVN